MLNDGQEEDIFGASDSSCKFYDVSQYNVLINSHPNYFRLLNYNIRSFHCNRNSFEVLIFSFPYLPTVIILTETW